MSAEKNDFLRKSNDSDSDHDDKKDNKIGNLITWNSGANLANNVGSNDFFKVGGPISNNENLTKIVITESGTIKNLTVKLIKSTGSGPAFPGKAKARNFVVRKNGVNTNLAVVITGEHDQKINLNDKVKVDRFDLISLVHFTTGVPDNTAIGIASVELV